MIRGLFSQEYDKYDQYDDGETTEKKLIDIIDYDDIGQRKDLFQDINGNPVDGNDKRVKCTKVQVQFRFFSRFGQ